MVDCGIVVLGSESFDKVGFLRDAFFVLRGSYLVVEVLDCGGYGVDDILCFAW